MREAPGMEIVPLHWCINAMQRALERVRTIGWDDDIGQYAAVSETLFWIDIVEAQLRKKYPEHHEATLDDQASNIRPVLVGLLWVRNRITHEVDEIRYLLATAKSSHGFDAEWTWQPLPPRPEGKHPDGHAAYQSAVAGQSVVSTLLVVTVCLGQAVSRVSRSQAETTGR